MAVCIFFFFNDTATTEIYTLSLHDALPISSKLTEDGERLLDYARRIVKLNVETIAAFSDELTGRVRLGVPDDYADRYLPEIMARFSRAYPAIELTVICEETVCLLERVKANEIDLAIITNCSGSMTAENFRQEIGRASCRERV